MYLLSEFRGLKKHVDVHLHRAKQGPQQRQILFSALAAGSSTAWLHCSDTMRSLHAILKLPRSTAHADLRAAYQRAALRLHPDHGEGSQSQFVELQQAWERYAREPRRSHSKGGSASHGFTDWGVGCSFSDTPAEREARMAVMEQASKGFLSGGHLSESPSTQRPPLPSLAVIMGGSFASMAVVLLAGASMLRSWMELSEAQVHDADGVWRAVLTHERRFQRSLGLGFAHEGDDAEPSLDCEVH